LIGLNLQKIKTSVPKILVLDASYSFETILARKLEESITCRDLEGFFNHVWTVHPFASLVTSGSWDKRYGRPKWYTVAPSHTFIEGKIGRFPILNWLPPVNFILAQIDIFFILYRLIRKEKINVIRVGDPFYLGILGWCLARLCGIPLVVRVGGNYDKICETSGKPMMPGMFFTRKIEKKVERFILSHADLVAGANEDNLNFALQNGARPKFSTLFRYGNLINKLHFVEPDKRIDGTILLQDINVEPYKFLLYIGRLETVKHPEDILKVLTEIKKRGKKVKAVLVGDGQCYNSLLDLTNELSIQNDVVFTGSKDQEWLSRVIPLAAIVVSPHTGRALSEAALGGVPIVAYDIDWQGELIKTGVTGELVPYGDWKKMADSAERLLNDLNYSNSVRYSVRRYALEMMDPEKLNEHERKQYSILLEAKK
jgi:glycosyltransferase involved in cell wall biosynthesis